MSCTRYLNELETERLAIEAFKPSTPAELRDWWKRLGNWWDKRHLGFGDGKGMASHCHAIADRCTPAGPEPTAKDPAPRTIAGA